MIWHLRAAGGQDGGTLVSLFCHRSMGGSRPLGVELR